LDRAHDHHVVVPVAHHLELELLPAQQALLDEDAAVRARGDADARRLAQVAAVVHQARALAAERERRADDERVAELLSQRHGVGHGGGVAALRQLHARLLHRLLEPVAILGGLDGGERGADQLHVVAIQHTAVGEGHGQVQRRLAAERGQQRVGPLLLDDALGDLGDERLDVRAVGELRVGHDRGRVGVEQHDFVAERLQRPASLRPGVIELAGLPDDDRAGAEDEDAPDVGAPRHQLRPFASPAPGLGCERRSGAARPRAPATAGSSARRALPWPLRAIASANALNHGRESCGPGLASGWYWQASTGSFRCTRPSSVPSLPLTCVTSNSPSGSVTLSTMNPWFWLVTSTTPVRRSITGWLMPRWPNFNFRVLAPNASPSSWWPRQMPNVGSLSATSRAERIAKSSGSGSPGPFESSTPAGSSARISLAGVRAGNTRTRNPCARSRRRMLYLTPKS